MSPRSRMRIVVVQAALLALGVLPGGVGAANTEGRTQYSSATARAFWHDQNGCDVTDVQVFGYDSSIRNRIGASSSSEVGVWINEYDACTGFTRASWQGTVAATPGEIDLPSGLQQGRITARVPVTDFVAGAAGVVTIDIRLTATGLAHDQMGASHFRGSGSVANWAGTSRAYDATVNGDVLLGEQTVGVGVASGSLSADDFGQTLVSQQALLARVAAGNLGGKNVIGSSYDSVYAEWVDSDPTGCRSVQTSVRADDVTDWSGTRNATASIYRVDQNSCTGEVDGLWASAPLEDVEFQLHSTSKASLEGTLAGRRFSGEPVSIQVDLEWSGTGSRSDWQLTIIQRNPATRTTFHHNESWRNADVTGTIDGISTGPALAAGFHRDRNIATNG